MEFIGHIILTGTLECLTGFATRGEHPTYRVAAVDLPILRNPITQMPYIPGSLLKGKLRYLLEQLYADRVVSDPHGTDNKDGICRCGKKDCPICPLFGVEHQGSSIEVGCRPARLRFLDLLPTEETQKQWQEEQKAWGNFIEIKAENAVDRLSRAANPRLIERVPPGARFRYKIQMGLYRFSDTDDPLADLDRLPVVETAFRLLEDDTLGGHGSRGYGQVRVHPWEARFVSRMDYHLKRTGTTLAVRERYREDIQHYREQEKNTPPARASVQGAAQQPSQPTSDIHIVTFRPYHTLASEPLHSDTLFGALAWALRLVHGSDTQIVERLLCETDLAISSVFPFVEAEDKSRLFFFPRPLVVPPVLKDNDKERKAFAEWQWASLDVFNRLINGKVTEEQIRENFCLCSSATRERNAEADKEYLCLDRKYLLTREEYRKVEKVWRGTPLFDEADLTRTRIDRHSGGAAEGKLFFTREILITDKRSGYFFLVRTTQDTWQRWQEPLAAALVFLADRGLGGDISAGRGRLQDLTLEKFTSFCEPALAKSQRFVTLSLYYPEAGEVSDLQRCWYRLLPRKGKVEMTYLRQANPFKTRLQMFAEGSTFPLSQARRLVGQNPQVQKDQIENQFAVVQWGRPFAVRMMQ
jgi:CRISPR-associated protein Csm3